MEVLKFNQRRENINFKALNATNGGPWHRRYCNDQWRSNFEDYKAARIPYSRNHDSNLSGSAGYGSPYAHDIHAIFPDFDADENDPASYDFACTDEALLTTLEAGTETFYRLGESIEHQIKKHHTLPPKDFHKWARICEHVIRHFNEGWGDGLYLNIEYWEIWNEPDLGPDNSIYKRKRTWGGTKEQFFDFYEIAAKHLKECFPHLKIGGPSLAGDLEWGEEFLSEMKKRDVPLDFFSWHIYAKTPQKIIASARTIRKMMDQYGYENAESILNEYNYVRGWTDEFVYTILQIAGIKGGAFLMGCICAASEAPVDMLMYYSTCPSSFCGIFDERTFAPLKGYYAFQWYGMFYDLHTEIRASEQIEDIYTLCGEDENGKIRAIITYATDDDDAVKKTVQLDFLREAKYEVYLVDAAHDGELMRRTKNLTFTLEPNSFMMLKEV